ncbi:MAG TPA: (Fe-S)-binding protein [Planctomycetota bacterium]|jgi:hypothetical protein|nr:(Fe-S)-binding protein [Planctomycetota bacterium]
MLDQLNTIRSDLLALWKRQSRSFLSYIVEVATPVKLDDVDEAAFQAFKELHEAEAPIHRRIFELLSRLGVRPDLPSFGIKASQYNFVRGRNLAKAFLDGATPELEILKSHRAKYDNVVSLEERLMRGILDDTIAVRDAGCASLKKILQDAQKRESAEAGDAVVEEAAPTAAGTDNPYPWHDESLGLEERMKLAEGKGLFERLFAAMAQTDCTACGYDCEGYARAIADGEDSDLGKCAPGMEETKAMLKKIMSK